MNPPVGFSSSGVSQMVHPVPIQPNPAQLAIQHARCAAAKRHVVFTTGARELMMQQGALSNDVFKAIETTKDATQTGDGKWQLTGGFDTDGGSLNVVVDLVYDHDARVRVVATY